MSDVRGQLAVITGAASGIGLALAVEASRRGMNLLLADFNDTALQAVVSSLARPGQQVRTCPVDVSNEENMQLLAKIAEEEFAEVNLLFNNAGICPMGMTWDMKGDDWRRTLDVNLMGVVNGINAFLPMMMKQKGPARIVNTGSIAGLSSNPGGIIYGVSKHAVVALSEGLYMDLQAAQSTVAVSVVCPGFVNTNLGISSADKGDIPESVQQGREALKKTLAQGLSPEELAERVFSAIGDQQFWIFPQPEALGGFDLRVRSIQGRTAPEYIPLLDAQ